jgi:hypothetical protein
MVVREGRCLTEKRDEEVGEREEMLIVKRDV